MKSWITKKHQAIVAFAESGSECWEVGLKDGYINEHWGQEVWACDKSITTVRQAKAELREFLNGVVSKADIEQRAYIAELEEMLHDEWCWAQMEEDTLATYGRL
jgi:hypothetical protein